MPPAKKKYQRRVLCGVGSNYLTANWSFNVNEFINGDGLLTNGHLLYYLQDHQLSEATHFATSLVPKGYEIRSKSALYERIKKLQTTFMKISRNLSVARTFATFTQMCDDFFPLPINQLVDAEQHSSVNTATSPTSTPPKIPDIQSQSPVRTSVSSPPQIISSKRLFSTPCKTRKQTPLSVEKRQRVYIRQCHEKIADLNEKCSKLQRESKVRVIRNMHKKVERRDVRLLQ